MARKPITTKRVNLSDCAEMVRLSELAYLPRETAAKSAAAMGFSECHHVGNNGGAHALVVGDASRLIIAVRGTQLSDLYDVFSDSWAWPRRDYQGGFVHRGFYNYCSGIWVDLEPFLFHAQGRDLVFTGHSLGGISALIFAAWSGVLRRVVGAPLAHVVTVGAPMGCSWGFCKAVVAQTNSITRVTNNLDPVPFSAMWPVYRHPRSEHVHITSAGQVVRNPTWQDRLRDFPQSLMKTAWSVMWHSMRRFSILQAVRANFREHDHLILNYRSRFDAHQDQ